jgi:LuxR family maltose regulon positive regulatory protein
MSQGLSNKEIAAQLYLSIGSVKQYAHRIYQKLKVPNRREAVRRAIDLRILAAP